MRKKVYLFLILLILFAGFLLAKGLFLSTTNQYGVLKVVSSPNASLFVNNVNIGKTPYEDKIKVGEYILKLIPEGEATQAASWQGKIKIYKNTKTYVNRELGSSDYSSAGEVFSIYPIKDKNYKKNTGAIEVNTEPQGAIVYLDNEEKGVSPLIMTDVPIGDHEISVYLPGFFRRTQKINIDEGYQIEANFKLAVDQTSEFYKKQQEDEKSKEATAEAKPKKPYLIVKENELGFLRVREKPTIYSSESARLKVGDKFEILEESQGWYKIEYEKGKEGWVSSLYVEKKEE